MNAALLDMLLVGSAAAAAHLRLAVAGVAPVGHEEDEQLPPPLGVPHRGVPNQKQT